MAPLSLLTQSLLSVLLLAPLSAAKPGTVQLDFTKRQVDAASLPNRRLRKRAPAAATLLNDVTIYEVNATIGTPGQPVSLQVDTGSSDVWVCIRQTVRATSADNSRFPPQSRQFASKEHARPAPLTLPSRLRSSVVSPFSTSPTSTALVLQATTSQTPMAWAEYPSRTNKWVWR
jgi:Eukaryotic aspartyl protease